MVVVGYHVICHECGYVGVWSTWQYQEICPNCGAVVEPVPIEQRMGEVDIIESGGADADRTS